MTMLRSREIICVIHSKGDLKLSCQGKNGAGIIGSLGGVGWQGVNEAQQWELLLNHLYTCLGLGTGEFS